MQSQESGEGRTNAPKKRAGRKRVNPAKAVDVESLSKTISEHGVALESLKNVPDQIAQILAALKPEGNSHEEIVDEGENEESNDIIQDLLFSSSQVGDTNEDDNDMVSILEETKPVQDFGDPISQKVAESITNLFESKYPKEKMDLIKKENKAPQNCKAFLVPRINVEIWPSLPQKVRQSDYSQQLQQQQLSLASTLLARLAEKLFSLKEGESKSNRHELLKLTMEAQAVVGGLFQDVSSKRRLDIKPTLNKEVAGICTANIKPGEWLFGENINELIKSVKTASSMVRTAVKPGRAIQPRFSPYNVPSSTTRNLNFNAPPARGRWGNQRYQRRGFPNRRGNYQRPTQQN